MFLTKYKTRTINKYKRKKVQMIEKDLPFKGVTFRRNIRGFLRLILAIKSKLYGLTYEFVGMATLPQNEATIYAVTHIGKFDYEMLIEAYKVFAYAFAGDWELDFCTIDDYFLRLSGVLYVDTYDKSDRRNSMEAMKRALKQNIPVIIYPESMWNLTENLPVMKLYSGAVLAAKECNVPIVPIGMEQRGKHFYINVGEKLEITDMSEQEALMQLRDMLATLRWEIWERFSVEKRQDIPANYYENFVKKRVKEWPVCTIELVKERQFLDKADRELISVRKDLERLKKSARCQDDIVDCIQ